MTWDFQIRIRITQIVFLKLKYVIEPKNNSNLKTHFDFLQIFLQKCTFDFEKSW